MGMFDYVNVKMPCPNCGKVHKSFQTKEGLRTLDTIEPDGLGCFYSYCECGAWIEFSRHEPEKPQARERPRTREEVEAMGFVLSVTVRSKTPNVGVQRLPKAVRCNDGLGLDDKREA